MIEKLYDETEDDELLKGFALAERLHANFYYILEKKSFEAHRREVLKLIEKLKKLAT